MKHRHSPRLRRSAATRTFVFVHRWLGTGLALLMLLWSVSGIVMVYVAFPTLTEAEYLSGLERVSVGECCAAAASRELAASSQARIEMLDGMPVARISMAGAVGDRLLDLRSGYWLGAASPELAATVAADHMAARGKPAEILELKTIDNDQWTVYSRFQGHRPIYKVTFDSPAEDVLYVSGATAAVIQDTTARERFWNWLGAVPHWLYFRAIREHQAAWYGFVVFTSLLGTILSASGLYLGVRRTLATRGRWTPYRGSMRWHHVTGLMFGVLVFTWVFSGVLSMNPWGWLESDDGGEEVARAAPDRLATDSVTALLTQLSAELDQAVVQIRLGTHYGEGHVVTVDAAGRKTRLAAPGLTAVQPTGQEIIRRLSRMRPNATVSSVELLREEDDYWFSHKTQTTLPVIRAVLDDAEETRYYFDADTGEFLRKVDRAGRLYRWLHFGLHRLDFAALLRVRPVWDFLILVCLLGVTFLSSVGCWVAYKHLRAADKARARQIRHGSLRPYIWHNSQSPEK